MNLCKNIQLDIKKTVENNFYYQILSYILFNIILPIYYKIRV